MFAYYSTYWSRVLEFINDFCLGFEVRLRTTQTLIPRKCPKSEADLTLMQPEINEIQKAGRMANRI